MTIRLALAVGLAFPKGAEKRSGQTRRAVGFLADRGPQLSKKILKGAVGRDESDKPSLGKPYELFDFCGPVDSDRAGAGNGLDKRLSRDTRFGGREVDKDDVGICGAPPLDGLQTSSSEVFGRDVGFL